MSKTKNLTIGQKLYKRTGISGVLEYEVTGKVERKETTIYEVKCLHCKGHEACEFLISYSDPDGFLYVGPLNESSREFYYFNHQADGEKFSLSYEEAMIAHYQYYIKMVSKDIEKMERSLQASRDDLLKMQTALEDIENTLQVGESK